MEAIGSYDLDVLDDKDLEYAAYNGAEWAGTELEKRLNEQELTEINKQDSSLLEVMSLERLKLPTPKAIIEHCKKTGLPRGETLFGEINDLYNSLNFHQKTKYFTGHYVDIDEIANILRSENGFPYEGSADFLADFAANVWGQKETRFSSSDVEPFDENNPDYKKQYDEIVAKYKGTPLWLKAPNGKPTKLSERQWVQVRTQAFKNWFGDWEKEAWAKQAMDFLETTEAVANITGKEFQKDNVKLTDKVSEYFKSIGGIAHNEELGDVVLDFRGIKDSMGHGIGRLKASAFMAVKDVIEKGFIFNRETNWKGRGYDTAVITAPIKIGDENYVCEVVVIKSPTENKFYLHEVETKKTLENLFKTTTEGANSQASRLILGKHLAEVKGNVSKVVDENGEPLVVYHGSPKNFTIFDHNEKGKTNSVVSRIGFWFSPIKSFSTNFVKDAFPFDYPIEYATFLNLRNPKIFSTTKHADSLLDLGKKIKRLDDEMKALNDKWVNNLNVSYADKEAFLHFRQGLKTNSDIIEWFETRTPNGKSAIEAGRTFNNLYKEHKKLSEEYDELHYSDSYEKLKTNIYKLAGYDAQTANFGGVGMAVGKGKQMADKWVENAQAEGFDGVIVKNTTYDSSFAGGENDQLVAFNSTQIKSATDNVGTFDGNNPDIRWSVGELRSPDEIEALNKQFTDLYEQYKNGDQEAYTEAAKLVAEEARRKGYDVKVYHGTGADGFEDNIADATSKFEENGEGAQAHGKGLYMAMSRDTAEEYRDKLTNKTSLKDVKINGNKSLDFYGIYVGDLVEDNQRGMLTIFEDMADNPRSFDFDEAINVQKEWIEADNTDNLDKLVHQELYEFLKNLKEIFETNGLRPQDVSIAKPKGTLFDWFHNMKPEELLDEEKRFSEQNEEVQKKLEKIAEENPNFTRFINAIKENYVGEALYKTLKYDVFIKAIQENTYKEKTVEKLLLDYGIRGITYDGRQDGRCFVSFEGGATVKLQDPFTFDDNGNLIPLTERFNSDSPDMRFSSADLNTPIDKVKSTGKLYKKIEAKLLEFKEEIKGELLTDEEKGILAVLNKDEKYYHIKIDDIGNIIAFLRTSRDKSGANHILIKHYGLNAQMGYVSAKEILNIGWVIRNGELNIINDYKRSYTIEDPNIEGRKLVVVVAKSQKKKQPDFVFTFYSNKKAEDVRAKNAFGQPHSVLSSSTGNKAPKNTSESQGEISNNVRFSSADVDFEGQKRRATLKLALEIYAQAGADFDPTNGSSNGIKATDEQIEEVFMSDLSYLDEDVEEIVNNAEAIAYKLASRGGDVRNIKEEAREIEEDFHRAKIVEICVKDAMRKWKKDLQVAEKFKAKQRRELEAEKKGIKAFTVDELAIDNIDLLEAISSGVNVENELNKILEKCKNWADSEGVGYDLMLEKFKLTLGENFEVIAERFVRFNHIKGALNSIAEILESETESQAIKRAKKLSEKLNAYLNKELEAFEKEEASKAQKEADKKAKKAEREAKKAEKEKAIKAEKRLKKAHSKAVKMLLNFAKSQKLPAYSQLEIKRKLPASIQAYLAQIKKVMPLSAEEVKTRFQYLSERKGKLEVDGEDLNYKERYELSALLIFGNIKEKSLPELLEIHSKLKELIEGQKDPQMQRLEEMQAKVAKIAAPLVSGLSPLQNREKFDDSGFWSNAGRGLFGVSMMEHRLRNLFLANKFLSPELKKTN